MCYEVRYDMNYILYGSEYVSAKNYNEIMFYLP